MLTVSPAYGRDYKSKKAALADWADGKDFRIETFGPDAGRYVNIADHPGPLSIRYNHFTRVVITKAVAS